MKTDNSIASFWHSHPLAEKEPKLLSGRAAPLAIPPVDDSCPSDEMADNAMLEVVEYHP